MFFGDFVLRRSRRFPPFPTGLWGWCGVAKPDAERPQESAAVTTPRCRRPDGTHRLDDFCAQRPTPPEEEGSRQGLDPDNGPPSRTSG